MDALEIVLVAAAALAVALLLAWGVMKLIVSGIASQIVVAVRDFIQRKGRDRRTAPRETPDRRADWTPETDR